MATPLLVAEDLHLEYPTKTVFESLSLGVEQGDRIGIVGRNGDGKTTLLRLLSGTLTPQEGRVIRRSDLRLGVLSQTDNLDDDTSVHESIVGTVPDHEWASDPKIRDIIDGLVKDIPWEAKTGELSGGQRRRVSLAALLVGDWDLIALDEPTNHLDVEGITWLAGHLKNRWSKGQGGLLVITHDRWFLDEVCSETWEVHDGIVEPFDGGYAAYVLQRVERDRIAAATEAKRQNLMRKELAWLRRGAPARTSKPKFRIDAANELIEDVPPVRDSIELQRLAVARLGKQVVDLEGAGMAFGENEVLSDVTWRIAPGERTGILGANGAGKSTLLNLISGQLEPTAGRIKRGKTVKLGVLDQQFSQLAQIGDSRVREVLAQMKTTFQVDGKDLTPAQLLERLGFSKAHLSSRVEELSGGQKRRLQLLMLLLDEPNVIILDEPTNDVDHEMLTALEDLLDSWPGTLLVVSHDRYLLERVTDQQYAILDGSLRHLPGGIDQYLKLRKEQRTNTTDAESASTDWKSGASNQKGKPSGAFARAAEKQLAAIERKVEKLGKEATQIEEAMAVHDHADFTGLSKLNAQLAEILDQKDQLEERWLEMLEEAGV